MLLSKVSLDWVARQSFGTFGDVSMHCWTKGDVANHAVSARPYTCSFGLKTYSLSLPAEVPPG